MNRKSFRPVLSFVLLVSAWLLQADSLFGKDTIVHFTGPSFSVAGSTQLDVNADGISDFTFSSGGAICTDDVPPSACIFPYFIAGGTNEALGSDYTEVLPFGKPIQDNASDWTTGTTLTLYHSGVDFDRLTVKSYWLGGLGYGGIGYLGVRFHAADGLHYGWIRVRLPAKYSNQALLEFSPVVMEWAYETRPNMPIQAGDTGEDQTEFTVRFVYGNEIVQGEYRSSGKIVIGKNSLSYEIHLAGGGTPTGFTIEGNRKTLASIDFPYIPIQIPSILYSDSTLLFGEITIPRGQGIQVSRGRYYLKMDGAVVAEIVPTSP